MKENVEIIPCPVNWDEVRCRAAIAFMPIVMQVHELKVAINTVAKKDGSDMPDIVAAIAVLYADALIAELKKEQND
ncbi:MAG: hypothetical protein IKK27_02450 [Alistipes sp.]|nr:hypothetical protein [Alistipes sp.]